VRRPRSVLEFARKEEKKLLTRPASLEIRRYQDLAGASLPKYPDNSPFATVGSPKK
jgi:hypothetical protein